MSMPAISLVAVPGRRRVTIDIARDIERRGFSGIYTPSMFGNMSQCEAMAWNTERIPFGTAIAPIYARTVLDFAQSAAFMHEVSGGRFRLGIGVAHAPGHQRMGVTVGKPLGDTRDFVARLRAVDGRRRFPADHHRRTAAEDGGAGGRDLAGRGVRQRRTLAHGGVARGAAGGRSGTIEAFFIGNMLPTCISDDVEAAKAVCRRTLTPLRVPAELSQLLERGRLRRGDDRNRTCHRRRPARRCAEISDRSLAGGCHAVRSGGAVREGVEAWQAAGVRTPVIVPSSTSGGQLKALEEIFATFA